MNIPLPAQEGTVITTPRGLFIDFRNLLGRTITGDDYTALAADFRAAATQVFGDGAEITQEILTGQHDTANKRQETLVRPAQPDIAAQDAAAVRVLRLSFTQAATGKHKPAAMDLLIDLTQRTNKAAFLTVKAPLAAQMPGYKLFDRLEALFERGLLNRIAYSFESTDARMRMDEHAAANTSFSLKF
jgi:hypothetical protein